MKVFVVESHSAYGPCVTVVYSNSKEKVIEDYGVGRGLFPSVLHELPDPATYKGDSTVLDVSPQ